MTISTDPEPYHCLWNSKGENRLDTLLDLQEAIDDTPITSPTVRASTHLSNTAISKLVGSPLGVYLVDSWIPPVWTVGRKGLRVVNSDAKFASHYSNVAVKCDCGASITAFNEGDHAECCSPETRNNKEEQLKAIQLREIGRGANFNQSLELVAKRVGKPVDTLQGWIVEQGLEWEEMRKIGCKRAMKTSLKLREEGEPRENIGKLLGYS